MYVSNLQLSDRRKFLTVAPVIKKYFFVTLRDHVRRLSSLVWLLWLFHCSYASFFSWRTLKMVSYCRNVVLVVFSPFSFYLFFCFVICTFTRRKPSISFYENFTFRSTKFSITSLLCYLEIDSTRTYIHRLQRLPLHPTALNQAKRGLKGSLRPDSFIAPPSYAKEVLQCSLKSVAYNPFFGGSVFEASTAAPSNWLVLHSKYERWRVVASVLHWTLTSTMPKSLTSNWI